MQLIIFSLFLSGFVYGLDSGSEHSEKAEIPLREGKKRTGYRKVVVKRLSRAFTNPNVTKRKFSAPHLGSMERIQVLRSSTDERRPKSAVPLSPVSMIPPVKWRGPMTVIDHYKDQLNFLDGFDGKNFSHSTFIFCNCSQLNFKGTDLSQSVFNFTILLSANFTDADLTGAFLIGARLTDACFVNADLTDANLTSAILYDAQLINTNLTGAIVEGAKFYGADLRNAHTLGPHGTIRLIDKNYLDAKKAEYDEHTRFGFKLD